MRAAATAGDRAVAGLGDEPAEVEGPRATAARAPAATTERRLRGVEGFGLGLGSADLCPCTEAGLSQRPKHMVRACAGGRAKARGPRRPGWTA
jgi:hypothetical protein